MSMHGISGNNPAQPRLSEAQQQGEGLGGAKQRDDVDKSKEAHKALHKSRSEAHKQKIQFMVTKGANAAHTMKNAMLKPMRSDRIAENVFKKVHAQAVKQVTRKIASRLGKRNNSENASMSEEIKQKNAAMQAAMAARLRQMDDETEMDTDTDSESGGGDLSGGGRDQDAFVMLIKSMYSDRDQHAVNETINKLENKDSLSDEQKVKIVKSLHNPEMDKNPSLSENLMGTINSKDFNNLSDKTKNTILDFMSGDNIVKTEMPKSKKLLNTENVAFQGVLKGLNLSKSQKSNGLENVSFTYNQPEVNLKLKLNNYSNSNTMDLFKSHIDLKFNNASKDKISELIDGIANKISVAGNESNISYSPLTLKNVVKDAVGKINIDKNTSFRITLNNNGNDLSVSKAYKQLDKTRLEPVL